SDFGLELQAQIPDSPLLTTEDATQDGNSYVFSNLPLSSEADGAEPGVFMVDEPTRPPGYNSYTAFGDAVQTDSGGNSTVTLTSDAPDAAVDIYNWNQQGDIGTITLDTIVCP